MFLESSLLIAHAILIFFHRLRVELIILVIAFTGLALELVLGIITLWIFQRYLIYSHVPIPFCECVLV